MVNNEIILEACPVADGYGPCSRHCGGGWPGTQATTEQLTVALHSGRLNPEKLGCGPLVERANDAIKQLVEFNATALLGSVELEISDSIDSIGD